jgi:hypothetical protein
MTFKNKDKVPPEFLNAVQDDIVALNQNLEDENVQTASIPHGLSTIETDQQTLAEVKAEGRTLVNGHGKDGNCEDTSKFTVSSGYYAPKSFTLDSANKVIGNNSVKAVINDDGVNVRSTRKGMTRTLYANKYYLVSTYLLKGGTSATKFYAWDGTNTYTSTEPSTTGKFEYKYLKLTFTTDTNVDLGIQLTGGAIGDYGNLDAMSVYELTKAQYNEIDNLSADEVAEKYGYVDSVKSLRNPVWVSYGKNQNSPFTQWGSIHANAKIIAPYTIELNAPDTANYVSSTNHLPIVGGQSITISGTHNGRVRVRFYSKADDTTDLGVVVDSDNGATVTATAPANAKYMKILAYNNATAGTFTFENIQLELGTTATTFTPHNPTYLYGKDVKLGAIGDKKDLLNVDSTVTRHTVLDEVLDGSLGWVFFGDQAGYKSVKFPLSGYVADVGTAVKYDGKILQRINSAVGATASDQFYMHTDGNIYVYIADTDSGWTDAMTPTANMIKGYFNGWKYTGDGTTHSWVSIVDGSASPTQTEAYVSANVASGFTHYSLNYQLANSVTEPVTLEGDLTLIDGLNTVELSEGVVVREPIVPTYDSTNKLYRINYSLTSASKLKNRTNKIMVIFRGLDKDTKWTIRTNNNDANGGSDAIIAEADFDTTKSYYGTYMLLDKHLFTANAESAEITYNTNLKTVVDKNVDKIAKITTKQSQQDIFNEDVAVKGEGEVVQYGTGTVSFNNNSYGDVTITFPRAFKEIKGVWVNGETSEYFFGAGSNPTTTSCIVYGRHYQATLATLTKNFRWIAIGK